MAKQRNRASKYRRTRSYEIFDFSVSIKRIDLPFFILMLALLGFGLVMLFSASYVAAIKEYGDMYYYFRRQLVFGLIGIVVSLAISYLNLEWVKKFNMLFMLINILLLLAVVFIGKTGGGAQRWLMIGSLTFQPSEITKIVMILFVSKYVSKHYNAIRDPYSPRENKALAFILPKKEILIPLFVLAVNAALVAYEKHISATIIIVTTTLIIMFAAGMPLHWFAKLGVVGIVGLIIAYFKTSYLAPRIRAWLYTFDNIQDAAWQTVQSLYAIGSGGLLGLGLGNSVQKHLYLPEPQNDFIFSIVCEELGVVGALIVILLFGLLIWRGFTIALRCQDTYRRSIVIGVMSIVSIQLVLNIAVVTNLIPVTGISMPFFSYGGTALLALMGAMGLVLNISKTDIKRPNA